MSWPLLVCNCLWCSHYQPPHILNGFLLKIQCDCLVLQSSHSSPIKLHFSVLPLRGIRWLNWCWNIAGTRCLSVMMSYLPTAHLSVYRWDNHVLFPIASFILSLWGQKGKEKIQLKWKLLMLSTWKLSALACYRTLSVTQQTVVHISYVSIQRCKFNLCVKLEYCMKHLRIKQVSIPCVQNNKIVKFSWS